MAAIGITYSFGGSIAIIVSVFLSQSVRCSNFKESSNNDVLVRAASHINVDNATDSWQVVSRTLCSSFYVLTPLDAPLELPCKVDVTATSPLLYKLWDRLWTSAKEQRSLDHVAKDGTLREQKSERHGHVNSVEVSPTVQFKDLFQKFERISGANYVKTRSLVLFTLKMEDFMSRAKAKKIPKKKSSKPNEATCHCCGGDVCRRRQSKVNTGLHDISMSCSSKVFYEMFVFVKDSYSIIQPKLRQSWLQIRDDLTRSMTYEHWWSVVRFLLAVSFVALLTYVLVAVYQRRKVVRHKSEEYRLRLRRLYASRKTTLMDRTVQTSENHLPVVTSQEVEHGTENQELNKNIKRERIESNDRAGLRQKAGSEQKFETTHDLKRRRHSSSEPKISNTPVDVTPRQFSSQILRRIRAGIYRKSPTRANVPKPFGRQVATEYRIRDVRRDILVNRDPVHMDQTMHSQNSTDNPEYMCEIDEPVGIPLKHTLSNHFLATEKRTDEGTNECLLKTEDNPHVNSVSEGLRLSKSEGFLGRKETLSLFSVLSAEDLTAHMKERQAASELQLLSRQFCAVKRYIQLKEVAIEIAKSWFLLTRRAGRKAYRYARRKLRRELTPLILSYTKRISNAVVVEVRRIASACYVKCVNRLKSNSAAKRRKSRAVQVYDKIVTSRPFCDIYLNKSARSYMNSSSHVYDEAIQHFFRVLDMTVEKVFKYKAKYGLLGGPVETEV